MTTCTSLTSGAFRYTAERKRRTNSSCSINMFCRLVRMSKRMSWCVYAPQVSRMCRKCTAVHIVAGYLPLAAVNPSGDVQTHLCGTNLTQFRTCRRLLPLMKPMGVENSTLFVSSLSTAPLYVAARRRYTLLVGALAF